MAPASTIVFVSVLAVMQLVIPRRYALVPLLICAFHLPHLVIFSSFTGLRLLLFVATVRILTSDARRALGTRCSLDFLIALWILAALVSAFGHNQNEGNPLMLRLGLSYDLALSYICARCYLQRPEDLRLFAQSIAIIILPLGLLMLVQKLGGMNWYAIFGTEWHMVREGHLRVAGPFGNAILAGSAAATSLPLIAILRRQHKKIFFLGIAAIACIVFSASSSGPYLSIAAAVGALSLWRVREYLRAIRWGSIAALGALALVMKDPVWYLAARVDISGGSTGFHRAELITQGLNHISEWWLAGTDYTRHWLPYGIQWTEYHVDITNQFLKMGVLGGLPLLFCFVAILVVSFRTIGRRLNSNNDEDAYCEYIAWCTGAALWTHCVTFMAVSYFDQNYLFFYFLIGAIPGLSVTQTKHFTKPPENQRRTSLPRSDRPSVSLSSFHRHGKGKAPWGD